MRTLIGFISIFCIAISALLIISIPFLGLFRVFSLFPEWFYTFLFLGILVPYMIDEENQMAKENKQQKKNDESIVVTKKESILQLPSKLDTKIENLTIQLIKDTGSIDEKYGAYPFLIAADDIGNVVGVYKEDEEAKAFMKLCHRIKQYNVYKRTFEILDTRYAYITGADKELYEVISKNNLEIGSQIRGKIILIESLFNSWKGHKPKIDFKTGKTVGYTFENTFYPVFVRYMFTDDFKNFDRKLNRDLARTYFSDYGLQPGDTLPSFI